MASANGGGLWNSLAAWEAAYDGSAWIDWHRVHLEIPVYAVCFYVMFLINVPGMIENREAFQLKSAFAVWNLLLSVFSCIGASRVVPVLYSELTSNGFTHTVCSHPNWYKHGPSGLWMALFIYSKMPELL